MAPTRKGITKIRWVHNVRISKLVHHHCSIASINGGGGVCVCDCVGGGHRHIASSLHCITGVQGPKGGTRRSSHIIK